MRGARASADGLVMCPGQQRSAGAQRGTGQWGGGGLKSPITGAAAAPLLTSLRPQSGCSQFPLPSGRVQQRQVPHFKHMLIVGVRHKAEGTSE